MSEPSSFTRRRFIGLAAATFAAGTTGFLSSSRRLNAMTEALAGSAAATANASAIRPFQFSFPEAELTDLRKRINATKWPEPETVPDSSQGVQIATMQKLARYWGNDHDLKTLESRLKAAPHFITE